MDTNDAWTHVHMSGGHNPDTIKYLRWMCCKAFFNWGKGNTLKVRLKVVPFIFPVLAYFSTMSVSFQPATPDEPLLWIAPHDWMSRHIQANRSDLLQPPPWWSVKHRNVQWASYQSSLGVNWKNVDRFCTEKKSLQCWLMFCLLMWKHPALQITLPLLYHPLLSP